MPTLRLACLLGALALLANCAPSAQEQADLATVQESGVPQAVYNKMAKGLILDDADLIALAKHRVPDAITLRYLRRKQTVYNLDLNDINALRRGGVSDKVVNYLLSTPELYPRVRYVDPPLYPYGYGWDPGPDVIIIQDKKH